MPGISLCIKRLMLAGSAGLAGALLSLSVSAIEPAAGPLTMEERIACHERVEEVRWNNRIWPEGNPEPKPAYSDVRSQAEMARQAERSLRMSTALAELYGAPITVEVMEAELRRITASTRAPDQLRELFEALDNDPLLITECLVRPDWASRQLQQRYRKDPRIHGALADQAVADIIESDPAGAREQHVVYRLSDRARADSQSGIGNPTESIDSGIDGTLTVHLDEAAWNDRQDRALERLSLQDRARRSPQSKSTVRSLLKETGEAFIYESVEALTENRIEVQYWIWDKTPFESWWAENESEHTFHASLTRAEIRKSLPTITSQGNMQIPETGGFWIQDRNVPSARDGHTAIWTGTEMIIWGGCPEDECAGGIGYATNTGGRYDPVSNTWRPTSLVDAPEAVMHHNAVWTGEEMIVWGGCISTTCPVYPVSGSRYDPATDEWHALNASGQPDGVDHASAIWTGEEMIVWGGHGDGVHDTGGRYDPQSDSWQPVSTVDSPSRRAEHSAVWTGEEMIVWGGVNLDDFDVGPGGRYDPGTDTWSSISTSGEPLPRRQHAAVWTGDEMFIWGGSALDSGGATISRNDGSLYDPASDSWQSVNDSDAGAVPGAWEPAAVWTGSEVLVWGGRNSRAFGGGRFFSGGRYDPDSDSWEAMTNTNAPNPRRHVTAVWTGEMMVLWGGNNGDTRMQGLGRYVPADDEWLVETIFSAGLQLLGRRDHTAVWTGTEMLIWGGQTGFLNLTSGRGMRYSPSTDTWRRMAYEDSPPIGVGRRAFWTGTEMLTWGRSYEQGGGRYDPISDSWLPISEENEPDPSRRDFSAVWTGTEMIVWGGWNFDDGRMEGGGRYDPSTDTWDDVSVVNAPTYRSHHGAVWTDTEMIVWGGSDDDGALDTGARYDPVEDAWTWVTTDDAPPPLGVPITAWTGQEMIAWTHGSGGGKYDPATDSWEEMATSPLKPPAYGNSDSASAWIGDAFLVWGGRYHVASLLESNAGALYYPDEDLWISTNQSAAPQPRRSHSLVWTGKEAIIWGGVDGSGEYLTSGGRYDPATNQWQPTNPGPTDPNARGDHSTVWTGNEMIVWGGVRGTWRQNDGWQYEPVTDSWTELPPHEGATDRTNHTAVWTGQEMIIWGGSGNWSEAGQRYSPAIGEWTPVSSVDEPETRESHVAVWTGEEMLVWGGVNESEFLATGGRYRPDEDSWDTISTSGAPTGRRYHTSVWTGSEMIVWGGEDSQGALDTGSRYAPDADSWQSITTTGAPTARYWHTGTWTGNRMLIWGGRGDLPLDSGAGYDPQSNSWEPIASTNAPSSRYLHTAVWTGSRLAIWGGRNLFGTNLRSGNMYAPDDDVWFTMDVNHSPSARFGHSAVWRDNSMLIWGGHCCTLGFVESPVSVWHKKAVAELRLVLIEETLQLTDNQLWFSVLARNDGYLPAQETGIVLSRPDQDGFPDLDHAWQCRSNAGGNCRIDSGTGNFVELDLPSGAHAQVNFQIDLGHDLSGMEAGGVFGRTWMFSPVNMWHDSTRTLVEFIAVDPYVFRDRFEPKEDVSVDHEFRLLGLDQGRDGNIDIANLDGQMDGPHSTLCGATHPIRIVANQAAEFMVDPDVPGLEIVGDLLYFHGPYRDECDEVTGFQRDITLTGTTADQQASALLTTVAASPQVKELYVEYGQKSDGTIQDPETVLFDENKFTEKVIELTCDLWTHPSDPGQDAVHKLHLKPVVSREELSQFTPVRGYTYEEENQPSWADLDPNSGVVYAKPGCDQLGPVLPRPTYTISSGPTDGPDAYKVRLTVTE